MTPSEHKDKKNVAIAYGKSRIKLAVPSSFDLIEPKFVPKLKDEKYQIIKLLKNPIGSAPLRKKVNKSSKIAISVCDITRAQPRQIVLQAILDHISDITSPENIKILIATGTHRPNTKEELRAMIGQDILSKIEVINHDSRNKKDLVKVKTSLQDTEVYLNKNWIEADVRITTGFVEPHFFAGFSGGAKMVAPGLAGLETILSLHNYERLRNKFSVWGEIDRNPIQQDVRKIATETGVDFCIDVTLNKLQEITGVFAGELLSSHDKACEFAREKAMVKVEKLYDVVITSNSGYPLDQNLYQSVKGMSAASQITKKDGKILCLAECSDGIPDHGEFYSLLSYFKDPYQVNKTLQDPNFMCQDQWQVQILSDIVKKQSVYMYSEKLSPDDIQKAFLNPVLNPNDFIKNLEIEDKNTSGCVLPEGPITIPFFETNN
ncbi:MAG: hypothetical protein CL506_02615 [Actinobacteria bacterium]|nr:hypothetical protein [Actinomycetota bacterium]|tara:strand:- start:1956 stop:3254 length:1299 start_codon:yes stop_codon:yes gene_type:complete